MRRTHRAVLVMLAMACAPHAQAAVLVVAPAGGDFTRVQDALDAAQPGDTVRVRAGVYPETVIFPRSGAPGAPIALEAWPGEAPVLDGGGGAGPDVVRLDDRSHVRVEGLELRGLRGVDDGSGIRVTGAGSDVVLRGNRIHDLRGRNAMGITVYGTRAAPITALTIEDNAIFDCDAAPSEALAINGNVDGFTVAGNHVRDVNNIGIVAIGGETDIQPDPGRVARNGTIRGNRVERARSSYGGGYAAGIYVDGGRDLLVEHNVVTGSDLGLEVGAENRGVVARNVIVRANVLFANEKAGLVFGGYAAGTGRVRDSVFSHNTCAGNDTLGTGNGELWIQFAEGNRVEHNVFQATTAGVLLTAYQGNVGNVLDRNLWFTTGTPRFVWNGDEHPGLAAFRAASGQEAHGLFADPLLIAPAAGDVHLGPGSPAIDAGDPAFVPGPGETDLDGGPRVSGPRVDLGADEATRCGDGAVETPELCDDGGLVDGDGCDGNCTPTGCGNGVVTTGEACDDGGVSAGDCCDAACQLEPAGAPCDDRDPCTQADACDAGACAGAAAPALACRAGVSTTKIVDGTPDGKDRLAWKWKGAPPATPTELGDPVGAGTTYTLCLYDGGGLALRAVAPPGARWRSLGTRGFRYADDLATPDGVRKLTVGPAKITLDGRGDALATPALPLAQAPAVTIQLHASTGACWTARYSAPARRNDGTQFRDASD